MAKRRKKGKRKPASEPARSDGTEASGPEPPEQRSGRTAVVILVLVMVGAAGVLAVLRALSPRETIAPNPLNVIVVSADTLRADRLGCYGSDTVETPNLDRLAASGVLFDNATTASPLTLPSHATLFTGTYPIYHGVRDNGGYSLEPEQVTLAESLKERGYQTGAFIGAFVLDASFGLDQGFDRYADDLDRLHGHALNSSYRRGDEVLAEAMDWMSARDPDAPFFSWIHLYDTHRPYDPPEPFKTRYGSGPWGAYDGEVAYVDSLVGELVSWLDENGLADTTLLAFVADHGESLLEHDELTHGFFVYGSTMRVPFIVSTPYQALQGRRVGETVRTIDLMPTVLELVAASAPEPVQGVSLVPLMGGHSLDRELLAFGESILPEHYGWSGLASLRSDDFHYIEAPRPELYDLRNDPSETDNVARGQAATAREYQAELDRIRDRYQSERTGTQPPATIDSATRDRLAALGYLGERSTSARRSAGADPKDKIAIFKRIREAASDFDAGRRADAARELERVIELDPDIPEAHNLLGRVLRDGGELDEAIAAFQSSLAVDASYRAAVFNLALAYKEAGRFDEAAQGFERAAALDPRAAEARFQLADVELQRERYDEAAKVLSGVTAGSDHERAMLRQLEARLQLGRGQAEDARSELHQAIRLDPDLTDSHYYLGIALEGLGDVEGARRVYERELTLSPDHYRTHFNLAKLDAAVDREAEMIDHLEKSIAANPGFALGHLYLANAYLERGNLERAMAMAEKGIALRPEPSLAPFGHFILADVYQRLGRPQDAAREMATAKRLQGS